MTKRPCRLSRRTRSRSSHTGRSRKPPARLVRVAPAEDPLVAEGQPQQARPEVRPPRDAPHRPSPGSYAREKAPPAAPPSISRRMIASASFGGRESAWTKKRMSPRARPAAAARRAPRLPADASAITTRSSESGREASRAPAISAGGSSSTGTITEIMRRPDASIGAHADPDAGRRARGRRVAADGAVESRAALRRGHAARVPDRTRLAQIFEEVFVVAKEPPSFPAGPGRHPARRRAGPRRDPRARPGDRGSVRPDLRARRGPAGASRGADPGDRAPEPGSPRPRPRSCPARTAGSSPSPRVAPRGACRRRRRVSLRASSRCTALAEEVGAEILEETRVARARSLAQRLREPQHARAVRRAAGEGVSA